MIKQLIIAITTTVLLCGSAYGKKYVSASELNSILIKFKCKGRLVLDKHYQLISLKDIKAILEKVKPNIKYDCDDYSLILNAQVKIYEAENNISISIAFGECVIYRGKLEKHILNCFVTPDHKLYLIDADGMHVTIKTARQNVIFIRF